MQQFLELMQPTQFEYYKKIVLGEANKKKLLMEIKNHNIEEDFQSIEIRINNQILFEGYDCMEYGMVSKNFEIPLWFINKYIKNDMCSISNDW
jgi:hypothetical protein